jgi:hypothetical protein
MGVGWASLLSYNINEDPEDQLEVGGDLVLRGHLYAFIVLDLL